MADTYSIDPGGPVQTSAGQSGQAVPVQIQAAQPTQQINAMPAPDNAFNAATTDALLKLGSDILAPKIKEAQQAQFMEGVQRAATGSAVKDIVAEQPWYTQVFGPSSAVAGARAYATAQEVAKFGAEMENQMPLLAQKGPEALTVAVQGLLKKVTTGDTATDMAVMSQVVDQMAPLYKRHAKEHYLYQQNRANDAQVDGWTALGEAYQARAVAAQDPTKPVSEEDLKADRQRFIGSLGPFADQTEEAYNKNMTRFLAASAQQGNMHVIQMFKDEGFLQKLPPEDRAKLEPVFRAGARIALDKLIPKYGVEMALISKDMTQNPRDVPKRIDELNARAAKVSGVGEYGQLIPYGQIDNIQGSILTAQAAERERQATQADKNQKEATSVAIATTLLDKPGGIGPFVAMSDTQKKYAETALLMQWQQADVGRRATLLRNSSDVSFASVASAITAPLATTEATPQFQQAAALYKSIGNDLVGNDVRGHYFTKDQTQFLERYNSLTDSGLDPATAFQTARVVAPLSRYTLDPKDTNEMQTAIKATVEKRNENIVGWNTQDDQSLRTIQAVVGLEVQERGRGVSGLTGATQEAYARASANGTIQQVGKRTILGDYTAGKQAPLLKIMAAPPKGVHPVGQGEFSDAFEEVLGEKSKAVGSDLSDYSIVRLPDEGNEARMLVRTLSKDGSVHSFQFGTAEIRARASASATKKIATQRAIDTQNDDPEAARANDIAALRQRQADLNPVR